MSEISLASYAERARLIQDETLATGRRPVDREVMPAVRNEIMDKLSLTANDRLLDIGSGIGAVTVPLSYFVQSVTAVDHADVLARMPERPNIEKVPGDFLSVDLGQRRFTKALAYSVVHYLATHDQIAELVVRAMSVLEDGGLFLIGDVPNDSYRERYVSTYPGQLRVIDLGLRMVETEAEKQRIESVLRTPSDTKMPAFNDDSLMFIMGQVRKAGHHAWILRQALGLPFHHAREDILIQKVVPAPVRDLFVAQAIARGRVAYIGLSLREVQPDDCDLIYEWSQDPLTRKMSIRPEPFSIEDHRRWFAAELAEHASGDVRWYMLEEAARVPLAWAKYERVDGGTEVSVVVAPRVRGMRFGASVLGRSEHHAQKVMPYPLIALIRPENAASIRTFKNSGYVYVKDEERTDVTLKRYEKAVPSVLPLPGRREAA